MGPAVWQIREGRATRPAHPTLTTTLRDRTEGDPADVAR